MRTFLYKALFITAAAAFAALTAFSQEEPADTDANARSLDTTVLDVLADFDTVWQSINDGYVDTEFGGVNWEDIKNQYRPKVNAARDSESAYQLLAELVGQLKNMNTVVVPPWLLPALGKESSEPLLEYGGVGILLQELVSGDVMVLQVFSKTPAEAAGVLLGDVIVGVDNWRVTGEDRIGQIVERVRGLVDTSVALTLQDPDGGERNVDITRARIDLRPSVEDRVIDGSIGYIRIPLLSEDLVEKASRALPRLINTSGLILDLRSVSAGSVEAMVRIAQWFLGAGHMGGFFSRGEAYGLPYNSEAIAAYQRPVVVLTNTRTYGMAEILVYLLEGYGRAQIVGNKTAGGFELGRIVDLPSGGLLHMTVGLYLSPQGTPLPQEGIEADVEVEPPDLATVRQGRDTYIEKAVEVLRDPKRR